jgi:hypothetical protein
MPQIRTFLALGNLGAALNWISGGLVPALVLAFAPATSAQMNWSGQGPQGVDTLVFKLDSLEREIRKRTLTDQDKKQISQCARTKRQFLQERRNALPEVAEVDSALRAIKLKGVRPDDPQANRLMERKYSLEQGFENAWQATAEGKRCTAADSTRRRAGDAALKAHPHYQRLQERLKQKGLL